MADVTANLRKKGWSEDEINRVSRIFEESPGKKSSTIVTLDKVAYWTGLFLAILGNFVISVLLIPFLILMKSFYLYLALIFLGIIFGWVFNVLLQDLESIRTGQHVIAWIFIPVISIINVYVMANLSNFIATLMEIKSGIHEAPLVSAVYVFSFMFPYALSKLLKKQGL
jgi:hypothetical protein